MKHLLSMFGIAGLGTAADGFPEKATTILSENCTGCHGFALAALMQDASKSAHLEV